MHQEASRWVLTLVLLAILLPFPQADALTFETTSVPGGSFRSLAVADRRAAESLSALVGPEPPGLASSAARVSSEAVRAQFWMPAAAAPPAVRPSSARAGPAKKRAEARPASRRAKTAAARSTVVIVREGQTLWSVSAAHRVSVDAIVEANGLRNPNRIRAGQRLTIPGHAASGRMTTVRAARTAGSAFTKAASTTVRIARAFLWPARGLLTSRFGWRRRRHHDGIDIGAPYGTPIHAARSGRVIFAGWYYDYGRAVIIDHGGGLVTVYGHASRLLVTPGQVVEQGALIARVGSTGRATGPHLHFEVRVNGKPQNPIAYMN